MPGCMGNAVYSDRSIEDMMGLCTCKGQRSRKSLMERLRNHNDVLVRYIASKWDDDHREQKRLALLESMAGGRVVAMKQRKPKTELPGGPPDRAA